MLEIERSGEYDFKNIKRIKNRARMYLQSNLKVEQTLAVESLKISAMVKKMEKILALFSLFNSFHNQMTKMPLIPYFKISRNHVHFYP